LERFPGIRELDADARLQRIAPLARARITVV
jgi:hypothetical protein